MVVHRLTGQVCQSDRMTDTFDHAHVCEIGDVSFRGDEPLDEDVAPGRGKIEPWLSALLQAEHCSLLIGSGFTIGACGLIGARAPTMSAALPLDDQALTDLIEAEARRTADAMGRGAPNLEDRLRAAMAAREGLRIVGDSRASLLQASIQCSLRKLVTEILDAERTIANGLMESTGEAEAVLSSFLMSFSGRTPTRDRLHVFTTNYDRVFEHVCDWVGLRVVDRFVGSLAPRFRSSKADIDLHYNPPGIRGEPRLIGGVIRFSKLHGSIDWARRGTWVERIPLEFGSHTQPSDAETVLVFPNSYKDYETAYFPNAEVFRDFSSATVRPNSVVISYGYGFGDDHVNRVLDDMLSLPSTHLVIISFDAAEGRIPQFIRRHHTKGQIRVMLGSHYGKLETLTSEVLPQSSLADIWSRRARILRDRGLVSPSAMGAPDDDIT